MTLILFFQEFSKNIVNFLNVFKKNSEIVSKNKKNIYIAVPENKKAFGPLLN